MAKLVFESLVVKIGLSFFYNLYEILVLRLGVILYVFAFDKLRLWLMHYFNSPMLIYGEEFISPTG